MAKAGRKPKADGQGNSSAPVEEGLPRQEAETISGYFRGLFRENPRLRRRGNNKAIFDRWLIDHPGNAEVPKNIKNVLFNLKSVLRGKRRKKRAADKLAAQPAEAREAPKAASLAALPPRKLESLEEEIDECLTMARNLDREGLERTIQFLRRARNEVVWKMGEK